MQTPPLSQQKTVPRKKKGRKLLVTFSSKVQLTMTSSIDFFEYVRDQLSQWSNIDKKRMFGVVGLYREGTMFGIIANNMVYLKVDDSNKQKFLDAGMEPLRVFKSNSEVPSYYELPVEILENSEKFIEWAIQSYDIQVSKNK